MAEPKKGLNILARDTAFSKSLRTPPTRRSPFKIRDEDGNTLENEATLATDTARGGIAEDQAAPQQSVPDVQNATPATQQPEPAPRSMARDKPEKKPESPSTASKIRSKDAAMVVCRISFRVGDDLMTRAEKLAKVAKCPRQRVVTVAFNELRPKLVKSAAGIQESDIPDDRTIDTTGRLDTTLRIPENTAKTLEQRLDPAGFNGLNRLLSRWARSEFASFFDDYLRTKGY
ncbi:hypothetical protein [uncultured Paracoccus sp.]|uniref:hypothetical protein n=1 Tax=uncultured Paracoccus sp. TaxID=189685 RepID=UPI002619438E|nr:hypothetical protein [uncultured Paracoccus sp.]